MIKFQNMGIVEFDAHPSDKRSKIVHATPQADRLLETIYQDMGPDLFRVFDSLNGSDIETFAAQLKRLVSGWTRTGYDIGIEDNEKEV